MQDLPVETSDTFILDRPFYFIVVLWGERFREYFLEYALPSLLSPGNIPTLSTRQRSKFLIATRPEDWEAMRSTPIFHLMERYVDPVYIEIPECPPNKSGCEHMGVGHKITCEMAFKAQAYGIVVTPDCLLSEGSIERLQYLASQGIELVLSAAALRIAEEGFLAKLTEMGAIPRESRKDSGLTISLTGRQMTRAALTSFHSQALVCEWDAPQINTILPAVWWKVAGEEGIVIHSLAWAFLLLDYGAIKEHDSTTLDNWTLDGDYIYKNVQDPKTYVVRDSDEMFFAGWGPMDDRPLDLKPDPLFKLPLLGRFVKGMVFRRAFNSDIFDPLKRDIFFMPVRWHAEPLNETWTQTERHAMNRLLQFVAPSRKILTQFWQSDGKLNSTDHVETIAEWLRRWALMVLGYCTFILCNACFAVGLRIVWVFMTIRAMWRRRQPYMNCFKLAFKDASARRWLLWRFRVLLAESTGRRCTAPMPDIPYEISSTI